MKKAQLIDFSNVNLDELIQDDKKNKVKDKKNMSTSAKQNIRQNYHKQSNLKYDKNYKKHEGNQTKRNYNQQKYQNQKRDKPWKKNYNQNKNQIVYNDKPFRAKSQKRQYNNHKNQRFDRQKFSSQQKIIFSSKYDKYIEQREDKFQNYRKNRYDSPQTQSKSKQKAKILVVGLPPQFTNQHLNQLFSKEGSLRQCKLKLDDFGRSLFQAEVVYETQMQAQKAIRHLNGQMVSGYTITVKRIK